MMKIGFASLCLAAVGGIGAAAGLAIATVPGPRAEPGGVPDAGRALYAAHCAGCHGANLEGQPDWQHATPDAHVRAPPHDETGHTWQHPDAALIAITKFGAQNLPDGVESDMPAFAGKLSDAQIRDVLAYIKSRWPENIRIAQSLLNPENRDRPPPAGDWLFPAQCRPPAGLPPRAAR